MNTKHVPDLELCQEFDRLCKEKEIAVPEIEHVWVLNAPFFDGNFSERDMVMNPNEYQELIENVGEAVHDIIPAPLVSEQGEWLPRKYKTMYFDTIREAGKWRMTYTDQIKKEYLEVFEESTEANARQKMLNYLIAEGIITTL